MSVKLLSRVPWQRIETLALDEGSRTSVALVQILLHKQFGLSPRCCPLPLGQPIEDVDADAILLIGDRAIHPPDCDMVASWDLGEQWCNWSKLPFVFAAWIARPEVPLGNIAEALQAARDAGLANLRQIAEREASVVGLDIDVCHAYLRDNLHFTFGPDEQRGADLFFQLVGELGFASNKCVLSQR
jgi:chorismate dehydratase